MKKETLDTLLACCFAEPILLSGGLIPILSNENSTKESIAHKGTMALGMLMLLGGPGFNRSHQGELVQDIGRTYPGFAGVVTQGLQLKMGRKETVYKVFRDSLIEAGALNATWPPAEETSPLPSPVSVPEGLVA